MSEPKQQNTIKNRQNGATQTKSNESKEHEAENLATVRGKNPDRKKPLDNYSAKEQPALSSTKATVVDTTNHVNVNRRAAGSNWSAHCNALDQNEENDVPSNVHASLSPDNNPLSKSARLRQKRKAVQRNKYVAMDCEMVGVGVNGQDDMLARVSIVNKCGEVLLDKFVKPREEVTDYRTSVSGIRPHNIEYGDEFSAVQDEVIDILQGKILVGHAIRNDLAVLQIKHPYVNIRDTSRYKPLSRLVSNGRTPSLKRLSQAILGQEIQTGEHNSIEDARAAMSIYNRLSSDWEKYIQKRH